MTIALCFYDRCEGFLKSAILILIDLGLYILGDKFFKLTNQNSQFNYIQLYYE